MLLKNAVPYSARFDDVYFDANDPKAERESVYASAISEVAKDEIIIAESGFGFGLNFFVSAKKALAQGKKLHYIACEIEPISLKDLRQFYADFSKFEGLFKDFEIGYEPLKNEIIRLHFGDFVILDFYFGDAYLWLENSDFKADIWYLDGFSPSKNPELFSADFLGLIKEHCAKNAIVRSYSCARVFKDALSQNAFIYEKRAGQGKKREFLHATCPEILPKKYNINPWFARNFNTKKPKSVIIIGAGIAGMLCAYKLSKAGLNVSVIDENPSIKNGASSNLCGLALPLIHGSSSQLGSLHISALLAAYEFYKKEENFKDFVDFCGAKYIAKNETELKRFSEAFRANPRLFELKNDEIFVKKAMQIRPLALRQFLATKLNLCLNKKALSIKNKGEFCEVVLENNKSLKADIVVLCGGANANHLLKSYDENILLSSVRGQATHISPAYFDTPISKEGYICAASRGVQVIGSSFDRQDFSLEIKDSDNEQNITKVKEFLKEPFEVLGANSGLRSYSGDRFMLCSQMHDFSGFCEDYKALFWQKNKPLILPKPRYQRGIFVNTAHGAHALSTSVLAAEIITDLLLSRPLCVSHSLFSQIHTARFLIRKLKKGIKI